MNPYSPFGQPDPLAAQLAAQQQFMPQVSGGYQPFAPARPNVVHPGQGQVLTNKLGVGDKAITKQLALEEEARKKKQAEKWSQIGGLVSAGLGIASGFGIGPF
jgi:hypothetical protein